MSDKILLVGGGGHCKSVLDCIVDMGIYSEIGIIDLRENIGNDVMGVPIIGCDDNLEALYAEGYKYAFVTVGGIGNPAVRINLFRRLCQIGFSIPNIIAASACISRNVVLGKGIFIGKNAIVNAGASVLDGAVVNTGAIIEHDCKIGEFSHIAPGSVLSGGVQIGNNTHIGANCVIKQLLTIGCNTIIGMGSVVTKSFGDRTVAYGNPCKEVGKL